jgi:hypothetical protein
MQFLLTAIIGVALGFAPAHAQSDYGQTVLVAKQVGTAWKIEGGSRQLTGSAVTLRPGERMILFDKKGVRQFRGPAIVELTAPNARESLFEISYRALRSPARERQNSQVRGAATGSTPDEGEEAGPTLLQPRD